VPTDKGRAVGKDIASQVRDAVDFDPLYYHFREGGHVAALHVHRQHRYFAKIDIARFFYSISRSRVQRSLEEIGILRSRHYAKWSCVKNPYGDPPYALPYGFVQSPVLATLVVMRSQLGAFLRDAPGEIAATVYMDDISISCDDKERLFAFYEGTLASLGNCHFLVSNDKLRLPSEEMDVFNCDVRQGATEVRAERIAEFYQVAPTQHADEAFISYCASVEDGNF
jgi:hypothetical protein